MHSRYHFSQTPENQKTFTIYILNITHLYNINKYNSGFVFRTKSKFPFLTQDFNWNDKHETGQEQIFIHDVQNGSFSWNILEQYLPESVKNNTREIFPNI